MLERPRFTTTDPARLSQELDRYVIAVEAELRRIERRCALRPLVAAPLNGRPGVSVAANPQFDQVTPLNPALGAIDVVLPDATPADAGRELTLLILSTTNVCTLRPGSSTINGAASLALPVIIAAYIVVWDGARFYTVNRAI